MGWKKRLWGVLLIITALIIMQLPVSEADAAASASDFKMEGSTLVKYRGTETNVSIPDTVTVIGESAFEDNKTVELVVIPKSVKRIEAYAFWGCEKLDTVVLGKGLREVGDFAFTRCTGLEQITIPSNITRIGMDAFADCVNLKDVSMAPEVSDIAESAFNGCYQVIFHCEPGSAGDLYAQSFYERLSERPEYEDVPDYQPGYQPDTSTDSGEIAVPAPLPENEPSPETSPGEVLGSTKVVGNRAVVFLDNSSPSVLQGTIPQTEEETAAGLMGNTAEVIPKYTIVDGLIVADQAYYQNRELKQAVLPDGIREIGQFSFARSNVEQVTIPEGVTDIGYGAFYHCDLLAQISLPNTLQRVEPKAFAHTLWMEEFLASGEEYLISGGVLAAYNGSGGVLTIPEGVRVIAGEAFRGHTGITQVHFPDSVESIGEGAFEGCGSLQGITLEEGCVRIADRAFYGCPLESVALPASLRQMGLQAFGETTQLQMAGEPPEQTCELSAKRLSNFAYRGAAQSNETAEGVRVEGLDGAAAELEGAAAGYRLTVRQESLEEWEKAFTRNLAIPLPESFTGYTLELTDASGIPITRLGKQSLTVTIPLPEELTGRMVSLAALDRNGQLESVSYERVRLGNTQMLRFSLQYVSAVGCYSDGTPYQGEEPEDILNVETVSLNNMSQPPAVTDNLTAGKYIVGMAFLATGLILLLARGKIRKR